MKEIWKNIPNFEGYKISNYGRVKNNKLWTGKMYIQKETILKCSIANNGYLRVTLMKDGQAKYKNVHRLVAEAFIPNPNNYDIINHIDGNRANSNVNNLEWCTQKHNMREASKIGRMKGKRGTNNYRSKAVIQYDLYGNFIKEWDYMTKITEELGYDYTCISRCCNGTYKKSHGYIWKYKGE